MWGIGPEPSGLITHASADPSGSTPGNSSWENDTQACTQPDTMRVSLNRKPHRRLSHRRERWSKTGPPPSPTTSRPFGRVDRSMFSSGRTTDGDNTFKQTKETKTTTTISNPVLLRLYRVWKQGRHRWGEWTQVLGQAHEAGVVALSQYQEASKTPYPPSVPGTGWGALAALAGVIGEALDHSLTPASHQASRRNDTPHQ